MLYKKASLCRVVKRRCVVKTPPLLFVWWRRFLGFLDALKAGCCYAERIVSAWRLCTENIVEDREVNIILCQYSMLLNLTQLADKRVGERATTLHFLISVIFCDREGRWWALITQWWPSQSFTGPASDYYPCGNHHTPLLQTQYFFHHLCASPTWDFFTDWITLSDLEQTCSFVIVKCLEADRKT